MSQHVCEHLRALEDELVSRNPEDAKGKDPIS